MVTFTEEEVAAIYEIIDEISGGNAHHAFMWDGTDELDDPRTSAMVKVFKSSGRDVPENLDPA